MKEMTPEEAATFLRRCAEGTARMSQNWDNFEQIVLSTIKAAMDAARQYGRDEQVRPDHEHKERT